MRERKERDLREEERREEDCETEDKKLMNVWNDQEMGNNFRLLLLPTNLLPSC